jgi:hypothetical protein
MSLDPITAGIDLVKEVGGKLIDHWFPDPNQAAKAKMELLQMEQDGHLKELVASNERFTQEVTDRQSARERESSIATSDAAPLVNKVITPILAVGVVVLTFLLFGVVLFGDNAIDPNRKDLVIYILGALSSICGMVISYYFGSSSGSVQKTEAMESLLKR